MDKRKKILLIALVIVILATAIMFWPKNKNSQEQKGKDGANNGGLSGGSPRDTPLGGGTGGIGTGNPSNGGGYQPIANPAFPLKKGSKGNEVKMLQKMLNHSNTYFAQGRKALVEDGVFGAKTETEIYYWWGTIICTQEQYELFTSRYNSGIPAFCVPETWPLYKRQKGPNVKKLNEKLKLFPANSSDKRADVFGENTRAAVRAKIGFDTVSETVFRELTGGIYLPPGVIPGT